MDKKDSSIFQTHYASDYHPFNHSKSPLTLLSISTYLNNNLFITISGNKQIKAKFILAQLFLPSNFRFISLIVFNSFPRWRRYHSVIHFFLISSQYKGQIHTLSNFNSTFQFSNQKFLPFFHKEKKGGWKKSSLKRQKSEKFQYFKNPVQREIPDNSHKRFDRTGTPCPFHLKTTGSPVERRW